MEEAVPRSKLTRFSLSGVSAKRLLQEIAENSAHVFFTDHARQQMRRRQISVQQVLACLRSGTITESPCLDHHGNWKLTIQRQISGEHLGCAVAIDQSAPKAIIITAFWVA